MKQFIFFELLRKLIEKPNVKKKLKIFAIVGITGFFVLGSLTIWAGVSAFNYVTSKATEALQSPIAQNNFQNLKTEFKTLPKFQAISCWNKAQSLMAVQPWLERSAFDNLVNLKIACLDSKPTACEGYDCTLMKQLVHTAERSLI